MALFFVSGFKAKKEKLVNGKFDFKNEVFDFVNGDKASEIIKEADKENK